MDENKKILIEKIACILASFDPIGIIHADEDGVYNPDEYNGEAAKIYTLPLLSIEQLAISIYMIFIESFSCEGDVDFSVGEKIAGPKEKYIPIACAVWEVIRPHDIVL